HFQRIAGVCHRRQVYTMEMAELYSLQPEKQLIIGKMFDPVPSEPMLSYKLSITTQDFFMCFIDLKKKMEHYGHQETSSYSFVLSNPCLSGLLSIFQYHLLSYLSFVLSGPRT